tara:strand:- start:163 stop:372 length:210 start_codon:yes stop_codon:yes gene_type:complete
MSNYDYEMFKQYQIKNQKIIQLTIENYERGVIYSLDDWLELKDEWFSHTNFGFVNKKKLLKTSKEEVVQ